jgi:hypothetical protein
VYVNGHIYAHPPWWFGPYEVIRSNPAVALLILASLIAAPILLDRLVAAFLLTAVLVPMAFFAFVSGVQLYHYPYAWAPAASLLVAVVAAGLQRREGARALATGFAVVAMAGIVISAVQTAQQKRGPTQQVVAMLRPRLKPGTGVITATEPLVLAAYLPHGSHQVFDNRYGYRIVAVVVDPKWVALSPRPRSLPVSFAQLIAGQKPRTFGGLQVYVLPTRPA